jgi:hypothetical protein
MIVLGCSGVSPAEQMRFYTDELLRRHGFSRRDRSRMYHLRAQFEDYLRASAPTATRRDELAAVLRDAAGEPWFEHAYLPSDAPPEGATWSDMDFLPSRRCKFPSWRCGGPMRSAFRDNRAVMPGKPPARTSPWSTCLHAATGPSPTAGHLGMPAGKTTNCPRTSQRQSPIGWTAFSPRPDAETSVRGAERAHLQPAILQTDTAVARSACRSAHGAGSACRTSSALRGRAPSFPPTMSTRSPRRA